MKAELINNLKNDFKAFLYWENRIAKLKEELSIARGCEDWSTIDTNTAALELANDKQDAIIDCVCGRYEIGGADFLGLLEEYELTK